MSVKSIGVVNLASSIPTDSMSLQSYRTSISKYYTERNECKEQTSVQEVQEKQLRYLHSVWSAGDEIPVRVDLNLFGFCWGVNQVAYCFAMQLL